MLLKKRWAIIRGSIHGSYYLLSGPHTQLGARLRITNRNAETIAPWEGNAKDTLDAYVARLMMASARSGVAYPQEWERWR